MLLLSLVPCSNPCHLKSGRRALLDLSLLDMTSTSRSVFWESPITPHTHFGKFLKPSWDMLKCHFLRPKKLCWKWWNWRKRFKLKAIWMLTVMKLYPKLQFYATMVFPVTDSKKPNSKWPGRLSRGGRQPGLSPLLSRRHRNLRGSASCQGSERININRVGGGTSP